MEAVASSGRSLGELFVERGLISESDLELARAEEAATNRRLTDILVHRGLVSGHDITSALMEQLDRFNSGPAAAQLEKPEPVDSAGTPEPKPGLVLLEGDGLGEDQAPYQPTAEAHLDAEPAAGEPTSADEEPDDHESVPVAATAAPPSPETHGGDSLQPQALIHEADARRRAAEAELAALGQVWQGLQQVQAELESHSLSTPTLALELDATQTRLRTRENELSAEITLWEGAREEAERAAAELDELRRKLSDKVHELSETQAVAATWSARVAELEAEIEDITRRATAAAHVLEVLAVTRFAAPATETFPVREEVEPSPPEDDTAGSGAGYLYFVPNDESYDLVEREGAAPEVDEVVKVGELRYVVTKIGRSPLPSDARSCVFLAALRA